MDANDALKELTEVKPGDDVADVASSKRINAIQTMLRYLVTGGNVVTGPGVRKRTGSGWFSLTSNARGGGLGGRSTEYPFQLIGLVEPTSEFDSTVITRVRVVQGKINGEFPSGMGFDDNPATVYKLDITDNTTIVAQVTFDPETLELLSRFVFESDDVDDSSVTAEIGTINFEIGFAQIEYNAESQPVAVHVQNAIAGDITFELIYGALNGQPAIIPLATYGVGFIELP